MKAAWIRGLRWSGVIAAGAWLGTVIFLGYGVAGPIFHFLPSRTQAGTLNGIILQRMNHLEWVWSGVLLAAATAIGLHRRSRLGLFGWLPAAAAMIVLFYYSQVLTPRMEDLRMVVGDFDRTATADGRPERAEFDRLHHRYSSLVTLNLILTAAAAGALAAGKDGDDGP